MMSNNYINSVGGAESSVVRGGAEHSSWGGSFPCAPHLDEALVRRHGSFMQTYTACHINLNLKPINSQQFLLN